MRDTRRILHVLSGSLGLSLALSMGCTEGGEAKKATVDPKKEDQTVTHEDTKQDTKTVEPETADGNIPEDDFNMPSCPSGDWCGNRKSARGVMAKIREGGGEQPKLVDGCPEHGYAPAGSGTGPYEGLPADASVSYAAAATKTARENGLPDACCYTWVIPCPGGRPLLVDGEARIAQTRPGESWADACEARATVNAGLRNRIGQEWLADALLEHASVAAFARFTLQLLAHGAPPALVADAQRAALDEIEHAKGCFAVAAAFGVAREPTRLNVSGTVAGDLWALVEGSFLEGAVGETIAALAAARAHSRTTEPSTRSLLARILEDETRHAALAWRAIEWALAQDPTLRPRLAELVARSRPTVELPAAEDHAAQLADHGRLDQRGRAGAVADAWTEIIDPMLSALGLAGEDHPAVMSSIQTVSEPELIERSLS
jgi:hypothetical protein